MLLYGVHHHRSSVYPKKANRAWSGGFDGPARIPVEAWCSLLVWVAPLIDGGHACFCQCLLPGVAMPSSSRTHSVFPWVWFWDPSWYETAYGEAIHALSGYLSKSRSP